MTEVAISSRHNPRFKSAVSLREARHRRASGRLLVDGAREIGRALDAGLEVSEAWVAPDLLRTESEINAVRRSVDLWDNGLVFLVLLLCAGLEWFVRRRNHLT